VEEAISAHSLNSLASEKIVSAELPVVTENATAETQRRVENATWKNKLNGPFRADAPACVTMIRRKWAS
jgi:hypothetical protein